MLLNATQTIRFVYARYPSYSPDHLNQSGDGVCPAKPPERPLAFGTDCELPPLRLTATLWGQAARPDSQSLGALIVSPILAERSARWSRGAGGENGTVVCPHPLSWKCTYQGQGSATSVLYDIKPRGPPWQAPAKYMPTNKYFCPTG